MATHWKHLGEAFLINTYTVRFYGELEKTIQINVFFLNKSTDYTTNQKRQKQNKNKQKKKKKKKNNVLYHTDSKKQVPVSGKRMCTSTGQTLRGLGLNVPWKKCC